jgi:hypothetical protein
MIGRIVSPDLPVLCDHLKSLHPSLREQLPYNGVDVILRSDTALRTFRLGISLTVDTLWVYPPTKTVCLRIVYGASENL